MNEGIHPVAPGKQNRAGLTVWKRLARFPDENSARRCLEEVRWAGGRYCGHCGSEKTKPVPNEKPMPYWCSECRSYFSVKTGTPMQSSKLPLRKWVMAMSMMTTSRKGVSSMKLHRDLGVTQKAAWFMVRRIRRAWESEDGLFDGPFEPDATPAGWRYDPAKKDKKDGGSRHP